MPTVSPILSNLIFIPSDVCSRQHQPPRRSQSLTKKETLAFRSCQIEGDVDGWKDRFCRGFGLHSGGPRVRVLGDGGPGVVVGWQDESRLNEIDGVEAVVGAHGEQISDGDDQAIDAMPGDPFHVAEDSRIARIVDAIGLPVGALDFEDPPPCGPAIGSIGQARRVDSRDECRTTKGCFEGSSVIHADRMFDMMFVSEPLSDFEVSQNLSTGAYGDRCSIGDVVGMRMGYEDVRGGQIRCLALGDGVVIQERVDQDAGTSDLESPGGMSMPYASDL